MSYFTEDCVLDMPRGPVPGGLWLVGKQQVRKGIQARFDGIPDIYSGGALPPFPVEANVAEFRRVTLARDDQQKRRAVRRSERRA